MNTISETPATAFLFRSATPEKQQLKNHLLKITEQLLGLRRCQKLYEQLDPTLSADQFPAAALQKLQVGYKLEKHAAARIPTSGPCILIANHPYGGIEGLILIDLLTKLRPDFKVMANFMLSRIQQLRERLINVDPFGGENAAKTNLAPLRQSLNHLKEGGLLVIFPAGEVSSYQTEQKQVCDPAWSSTLPRLVRMSKAPVLPVYFPGDNGPLFQLAGRIHPRLRTALLPRMLLNKSGQELEVRIGNLLQSKKLKRFNNDCELNSYLRLRTYALELSSTQTSETTETASVAAQQQIIAALDPSLLEKEVAALSQKQQLLQSGEFDIFTFSAAQAPALLQEIGRLREVTFRQVGEGTGQSIDLDRFDQDYTHLCMWNREKRELVGSYRLGRVDELLRHRGVCALYTSTLFNFKPQLLDRLQNSLELGRSFIRSEYQRSYSSLLLLWKGIGHYLVANPQYRYLFGPVSISGDYSNSSRQLMTSALARNFLIHDLAALVQPRLPVPLKPLQINGVPVGQAEPLLQDMDEISALVADLEADNKGIPVLLRHYLGLGGKLLAFNLDPDFSDVIDGLLLVDLAETDRKQLQRYMGREGYQSYIANHRLGSSRCA